MTNTHLRQYPVEIDFRLTQGLELLSSEPLHVFSPRNSHTYREISNGS